MRSRCPRRAARWDPPGTPGAQGGRGRARRDHSPAPPAPTASAHPERRLQGEPAAREGRPSAHHEPQPGASAPARTHRAKAPAAGAPGTGAGAKPRSGSRSQAPGTASPGGCGLATSVIEGSVQSLTGGGRSRSGGCGAAGGEHSPARAPSHPLSPAGGALLPGLRTCSGAAGSPAPARLPSPLPHRLPSLSPSPSRSRPSLGFHDVIRWKSAMLRGRNHPALTRGTGRGGGGGRGAFRRAHPEPAGSG